MGAVTPRSSHIVQDTGGLLAVCANTAFTPGASQRVVDP